MLGSRRIASFVLLLVALAPAVVAQPPGGGPGGRGRGTVKLVEKFDADKNGRLERAERDAARAWLKEEGDQDRGRGRRRFGGRRGAENAEPPAVGPSVAVDEVPTYADHPLYDDTVLRTLFFEFEHDDWEAEMAAFYRSDVEIPATMVADGIRLEGVGVRFRGNTSFMFVSNGRKRPMNVSIDFVDADQRLHGYKTLNLLNCHTDPSLLREVLHAHIGGQYTPVPQAAPVHVVINGESWGVFANVQQFNKDYLQEAYGTRKGARWRVPPDFGGNGGMKYLGPEPADYDRNYVAKSDVDDRARERLVEVCRVLNETSIEERREQLPALLDIDDALWFIAIDNVMVDGDGYLTRASDHALYMDPTGVFHMVTHDNNEILRVSRGRRPGGQREGRGVGDASGRPPQGDRGGNQRRGGGRRGPGGPGGHRIEPGQSPLAGSDDENRPLLHRLLEVPEWKARYLAFVHTLAADGLDWDRLGPAVERLHAMIAPTVHTETRGLYDAEAFDSSMDGLREFAAVRRKALLEHESLAGPWPSVESVEVREVETPDGPRLDVVAHAGGDAEVVEATLHWQGKRPGPFAAVPMVRRDDGSFGAAVPPQRKNKSVHYYVEMRTNGDATRIAFSPPGASSLPATHSFKR